MCILFLASVLNKCRGWPRAAVPLGFAVRSFVKTALREKVSCGFVRQYRPEGRNTCVLSGTDAACGKCIPFRRPVLFWRNAYVADTSKPFDLRVRRQF